MKQSKKLSLIETITSTLSGFVISLILINVILPFYGFNLKFSSSIEITIIFTFASIARGYAIRRIFERLLR